MEVLHDLPFLFLYQLRSILRNPIWALIGLFQPLCYLFLFGPLLDRVSKAANFPAGGAMLVFVPGILVMTGLFSTAYVGFGLIIDLNSGMIERLHATPVSRLAILLGFIFKDILCLELQALVLMLIAAAMGIHSNLAGMGLTLILLALLGLCLSSCSYALALGLKDVNALSSMLNTLSLPILLLSGITLPLTLAPLLIQRIALFNPIAYAVTTARQLARGQFTDQIIWQSYLLLSLLALLALLWAKRAFDRALK